MAYTEIEDPLVLVLMFFFVEPLLKALIRVMINLMCKAEFNWNVEKYFLLNTTMVVTGSESVVLSIGLIKILLITIRWPLRYNVLLHSIKICSFCLFFHSVKIRSLFITKFFTNSHIL
jgi:hypothetical protein